MTHNRWQQIEEIFQAALDLEPAEREGFVEAKCAGDAELKAEVEKLLTDFDSADSFIESPVWTDSRFLNSSAKNEIENSLDEKLKLRGRGAGASMLGKRVGVYELTEEIGRGGMGAVYLAERADGEFRQKVAVKLIKRGMDTDFVLSRFRHERQILANLNHSNIVLLLDGGTTDDGLPYFVMDFVEGEPLHKYADRKKLNLQERLELFRQVCEAVDYAHQKKVVHRDLKPSNILVNKYGTPKLLDFGIAKLLDPEQATDTLIPTETHMRLMTPEYASPEQVSGTQITPASDIYSLGVLLYELVTGQRPYKFPTRAPHEVARIICEEDPVKPSEAAKGELRITNYELRNVNPKSKIQLDAEIDKIILKALRKNPAERYKTAAALGDDIRRYLEDSPVRAQFYPPAKKQVQEKKESELSIAILPFKMFGVAETETTGGGGSSSGGDEYLGIGLADSLVMRLSGVKRLTVRPTSSVLRYGEGSDPLAVGKELGVEFILNGNIRRVGERIRVAVQLSKIADGATAWAETFDEKFTDVLELEDSISEKVAVSLLPYLTGEERRQLEKRGTNSPEAYEAFLRGRFNWNLQSEEGFARAIQFFQRAVKLDPDYALAHAAIAEYYIFLGIHCVIPFGEGAQAAREAAEKAVRLDPTLAEGYAALGFVTISYDLDWKKADEYFRHATEVNPNSTSARFWRTALLAQTKRTEEAMEELKRLNEIEPDSLLGLHMLAWVLYHSRRFDESIAQYLRTLKTEPNYAWGLQTYSWVLRRVGRFDEAIEQAEKAVRLTGENPFYLTALAAAYADAGERDKAEELIARLAEISKTRFVSDYMLSFVYCAMGDKDKAFECLEKSLAAHDGWINWLGVEPQFDILRGDPRFQDLLRRTGSPVARSEEIITGQPTTGGGEKSIAVLPLKLFGAATGSADDEYLGIGLADALVTRLSNVRRLVVRPTSSVLPFVGSAASPFQAGRDLGVDYVLDGNIRRVGERIRVTVQLLNVQENSSRWAESFNELFTDVLELEDSISEKVVKSLIPRLTGEEQEKLAKRGTNNAEAYEAYLRGRYHWNQFTPDTMNKAGKSFQKAIELDPGYALAYVGLADFYIWANIYGLIPSGEALPLAEAAALRAIELDDKLGEAYASLGLTHQNRFSWEKAIKLYQKALELAPNYVHAHEWYAAQLVGHGKFDEGVKEMRLAESLDPLSLRTKALTSWTLYQAHYFEEALECARQIFDLDEHYPQGYLQMANNLLQLGRVDEAIANYQKFNEMIPNSALAKYLLCHALAAGGRLREAEALLEEVKTLAAQEYVKPYFLGMSYAALGRRDEAFENFEKAFAEDDPWMLWFGTEPMLDALRDDERFEDLLRRMNLPPGKRKKIKTEESQKADGSKTIAVLPLKLIGVTEQDDSFLAVGMADAMITRLSKVSRLVVRPTSSILRFENWEDPFEAGRELDVDFVLSGTVRRAGERIRISAQLLEIKTDSTRWADKFNENFTDVLDLEDLVAEKVARVLVPQLTGEERQKLAKRGTDNSQAFEAYLRGRHRMYLFTPAEFARAKDHFEEAIRLDPGYALAYVGLAEYHLALGTFAASPPLECELKARELAEKALAIDDTLGEALAILGSTYFADFDLKKVEETLLKSIRLAPNYVLPRIWLSVLYTFCGRHEEAIAEARRTAELNPQSGFEGQHLAWILYHARRFDEAVAQSRLVLKNDPLFTHSYGVLAWILRHLGQIEESIELASRAAELSGGSSAWLVGNLAASYARAGEREKARLVLTELENSSTERYVSPFCLAIAYCNLGETEPAFAHLENAFHTRDSWFNWISSEPQLDPLRGDRRFNELLRKANNPQAKPAGEKAPRPDTGGEKSLAVLPLKMLGGFIPQETGEEFLGVGLTDALIMRFSQLQSFIVRPTSSVMRFNGKDTDPVEAGRELNVHFVLDGNVRRAGNQLRVTLQLLDVANNTTVWAEQFNSTPSDIFILEDEISEQVAKSLLPQFSKDEQEQLAPKRGTNNTVAYEFYLRGRFHWNQFTLEGFSKAFVFYRRAVEIAPDYALAYTGLADYYNFLGVYTVKPFAETSAAAKEYALKAVALDPSLAEAFASLGFATLMHDFDWTNAESFLRRAIELNPHYVLGRVWYCYFLGMQKRFDEAFEQIHYALKLDSMTPIVPQTLNWTFYYARRYEESIAATRRLIAREPNYGLSHVFLSSVLSTVGQYDEAIEIGQRAVKLLGRSPYTLLWLATSFAAAGRKSEALAILEEVQEMSKSRYVSPYFLGMVYGNLGDKERAFAELERALAMRDARLVWINVEPQFDALHDDPRFQDLLRRTGNPLSKT